MRFLATYLKKQESKKMRKLVLGTILAITMAGTSAFAGTQKNEKSKTEKPMMSKTATHGKHHKRRHRRTRRHHKAAPHKMNKNM